MRRHVLALALLLAAAIGAGSCSRDAAGRLRGVVFVLLDTVRADRLSCAGSPHPTTPHIDALASEGVRFARTVSFAPWTLPSVAAMLSGQPANLVFDGKLRSSLVENLRRAGFETAAFTEDIYFDPGYGISLGFEHYRSEAPFDRTDRLGRHAAEQTFAEACDWLDRRLERSSRPFFLLVHTYEPHAPYTRDRFLEDLPTGRVGRELTIDEIDKFRRGVWKPTPEEIRAIRALYDGGVREADRHVGRLVEVIDAHEAAGEVLVVVTSDHGEELGEHYPSRIADHGHSLRDTLLLVPLVLRGPLPAPPGTVIETPVRTMDILPTVLDLAGVALPPGIEGKSLVPLLRGERLEPSPAFGGSPHTGPDRTFVRHLGYKLIRVVGGEVGDPPLLEPVPPIQLYDLATDPLERVNLADRRPDLVRRLVELDERLGRGQALRAEPLDEESRERLRALGYVR